MSNNLINFVNNLHFNRDDLKSSKFCKCQRFDPKKAFENDIQN